MTVEDTKKMLLQIFKEAKKSKQNSTVINFKDEVSKVIQKESDTFDKFGTLHYTAGLRDGIWSCAVEVPGATKMEDVTIAIDCLQKSITVTYVPLFLSQWFSKNSQQPRKCIIFPPNIMNRIGRKLFNGVLLLQMKLQTTTDFYEID